MSEFSAQPLDNNAIDEVLRDASEAAMDGIVDALIKDALNGGRVNISPGCVARTKHDGSVYFVYAPEEQR